MSSPLVNTRDENMAIILQELLRETRDLKEDNRSLREELRSSLQGRAIQQNVAQTAPQRRRRRNTAPKDCQAAVRTVYKALLQVRDEEDEEVQFNGFAVNERFDSVTNRAITRRLLDETLQDNGRENCAFTVPMIKSAIKRYFDSRKEDGKRQAEGTLVAHRKTCRKNQRLSMKQLNREDALATIDWAEEVKEKWQRVIQNPQYMSSEESEEEEDSDGQRKVVFKIKPLSWGKKELRLGKKSLDAHYLGKQSRRAVLKRVKRVRQDTESDRPRPTMVYRWAVKKQPSRNLFPNSASSSSSNTTLSPNVTLGAPVHASTPMS